MDVVSILIKDNIDELTAFNISLLKSILLLFIRTL